MGLGRWPQPNLTGAPAGRRPVVWAASAVIVKLVEGSVPSYRADIRSA